MTTLEISLFCLLTTVLVVLLLAFYRLRCLSRTIREYRNRVRKVLTGLNDAWESQDDDKFDEAFETLLGSKI